MQLHSNTASAATVAKGLFEFLGSTNPSLEKLKKCCLDQSGIDEGQFNEEVHYLRAFAIHYSALRILGDSSQGRDLRAAFLGSWDSAAKTSSENMRRFNEYFRRVQLYAEAVHIDDSAPAGEAIDRVVATFAELLGAGNDDSSRPICEACGSAWFDSTCNAVAQALQNMKTGVAGFTGQLQLTH